MSAPQSPTALWRLSEEHQDPLLCPLDIHEMYAAGDRLRARGRLVLAQAQEPDAGRRQRQAQLLDDRYLWHEPTGGKPPPPRMLGTGIGWLGRYRPRDDGSYIKTQWYTVLYVPVFPLGAYVVDDVPGGLNVRGPAPMPPSAKELQWAIGMAAIGVVMALVALKRFWNLLF